MLVDDLETQNPFYLKRQGKFQEALIAYAQVYAEAIRDENKFIAEMCFDQMVDIRLLQLLREGATFDRVPDLQRSVSDYLDGVLRDLEAPENSSHEFFDRSWDKFPRQKKGRPLFSVGKEQLVRSGSESRRSVG